VEIKFGKFETLLGYEVLDAPYNPHVTHSQLFFGAIPLFHTGILASGDYGEEWTWAVGVVNGWNNSIDFNEDKGVLARLGWADEASSLTFNFFTGQEGLRASASSGVFTRGDLVCATGLPGDGVLAGDCFGDNDNRAYVFDLVGTFTASDQLDLYGEFVYGMQDVGSESMLTFPFGAVAPGGLTSDPDWTAVMLGAIYDVNEKTTLALRGEWFKDDGNFRLGHGAWGGTADHYSATATLGRQLTDNLTARAEYRYDIVNGSHGTDDSVFFSGSGSFSKRQNMGILEVNYTFD
ncbi:MAG: outer membrane beta-barrel protein, partial [Deltaproteobacteria bacterium]|nr:outer membrane beta-barrel protein [Deltaproteobacteria bacterium]